MGGVTSGADVFFVTGNLLWRWRLPSPHYTNSPLWPFLVITISFRLGVCSCFIRHLWEIAPARLPL